MSDTAPTPADSLSLAPRRVRALQRRILAWYADNARALPWRHTTDPYAVLVSEAMLQQTQVPRVVPKYLAWMETFPTLEALAAASFAEVLRSWQGLGYNNRARRLRDCAAAAAAGAAAPAALPRSFAELRALPGIGPYTARAVLIFAHNDDLAAVDANVRRVLIHELTLPEELSQRRLQAVAEAVLPHGRSRDWHNALMDYGALVLTARRTGIASRGRQGAFEGSQRQQRARLLRHLLGQGPATPAELAAALGLPSAAVTELIALLERDGLVRRDGAHVSVA
jgi:A/G-specific adenine glycosylase